MNATELDLM